MTRRERLERKVERREEWASKAASRATAILSQGDRMASAIPMGQPILVGHYSEKSDRAYRNRIQNAFRRGFEQQDLAAQHISKADGLRTQLETSIFSDDDDAILAIEARIAEREAERERKKLANKLYAKGDVDGLAALGIRFEDLKTRLEAAGSYWGKAPYLPYEFSNLSANIRRDRQRLDEIRARQGRAAKAEQAGGLAIERHSNGYATLTFAEKPARSILDDLKANGFRWGSGSWFGAIAKLPASVVEMEAPAEEAVLA